MTTSSRRRPPSPTTAPSRTTAGVRVLWTLQILLGVFLILIGVLCGVIAYPRRDEIRALLRR